MANAARLFIGGITYEVRQRDIEDLFSKYGPIKNIALKSTYGFVTDWIFEFEDVRDAKDALEVDGQKLDGRRIAVELSRGPREGRDRDRGDDRYDDRRDRGRDDRRDRDGDRDRDRGRDRYDDRRDRRDSRGGGGRYSPPRNTDYRVIVENLPSGCSWQDLKDHFRTIGDVCFSDVRRDRNGREMGVIEYKHYEDMRKAVRELDRSRMRGVTIDVFSDYRGKSHSRSRSRSPARDGSPRGERKDNGSRSRSRSPARDGDREERKDSRGRSPSPEGRGRPASRSVSPKRGGDGSRSRSRSRS